jgi:hypothetical protein
MRQKIGLVLVLMSFAFSALAAKKNATVAAQNSNQSSSLNKSPLVSDSPVKSPVLKQWNPTCDSLLDTAVASTIKLEKTLNKKKKKLSQAKFNEKIQDELMVVQLNAWVCAVSSDQTLAASIERAFLQEYAQRVQNN